MNYAKADIEKFAELIMGKSRTMIPECIYLEETDVYEFGFDNNVDTSLLYKCDFSVDILSSYLCDLADADKFVDFVGYYFNCFLENKNVKIAENGYNLFVLKDQLLSALNMIWSIPEQEFFVDNSKCTIKKVRFTLHNKMGEGGFCTVYKCPYNNKIVYKVLNIKEKANVGSVHRFKREYEIMNEHNGCGYTVNVYEFDSENLVYAMDRAEDSLEEYIEKNILSEEEKDDIVIRIVDCMVYLHNNNIIHRDFHPGNILHMNDNTWCITDFGLAKELSNKYSHNTTTTHAVGRAWFTDPAQLFALRDGNHSTDMYSLAKTIDYVINENMSGAPHKYSAIVYKATAPNQENRYDNIEEMQNDIMIIANRPIYESPEEIAEKIMKAYEQEGNFDSVSFIDALNRDLEGHLMLGLICRKKNVMIEPYCGIVKIAFNVALREIQQVKDEIQKHFLDWNDFDAVASWAIGVIKERNVNDEICVQAADIVEFVASNVNRYGIKTASNIIKNDEGIDGRIRARLTFHEGY